MVRTGNAPAWLRAAAALAVVGATSPACGGREASTTPAAHEDAGPDVGDADAAQARGLFGYDGAPDTSITWCDAGAPRVLSVHSCEVVVEVPCGIPADEPPLEGGLLPILDCLRICPTDAGFATYDLCHLDPKSDDAGTSGAVEVDCIPDCT